MICKLRSPFLTIWLLSTFLFCVPTIAQTQKIEKLKEFFTLYPNYSKAQKDTSLYLQKFIAAPVISYSPETNFAFGTGAKYLFKFNGSGEETRVSNMPLSVQYTLNNQFFFFSGFEVFTNQEQWVIEGNLLFQNYPRLFYGIGDNTPASAKEQYDYHQLLIEPIFLKQMIDRYLFIGGGFRYNHIYKTRFNANGLIARDQLDGINGSTSVGGEIAALYDNRSSLLNAEDGWFIEFTRGSYGKFLGCTHSFNLSRLDVRHYFKPFKKRDDIVAFQFLGRITRGGLPFSEYAFLGSSEIMRGYQ